MDIPFQDSRTAKEISDYFKTVVKFNYVEQAYSFIQNYKQFLNTNPTFPQTNPELHRGYEMMVAQSKWLVISRLPESDVTNLIEHHLVEIFWLEEKLDPWEQLRGKLVTMTNLTERDNFRKTLGAILQKNNQFFLSGTITINGQTVSATVANWIKDSERVLGKDRVETLSFNKYLTEGENTKRLSSIEREQLRTLLMFYEKTKISSFDPEGIEETYVANINNKWKTIKEGQVEELPDDKKLADIVRRATELWNKIYGENKTEPAAKPVLAGQAPVGVSAVGLRHVPTALKSPEPAFFFNLEDEEEVDQFRIKNQELGIKNTLEGNLRLLAEEVIAEHNFQFKDNVSRRRFVQLFVSFMKDVRDVMEVKEMLLKSTSAGGLGLTSDKVEVVLGILKKLRTQLPAKMKDWEKVTLATSSPALPAGAGLPLVPSISSGTRNEERETKTPAPMPKLIPQVQPSVKATPDELAEWRQELLAEIAKTSSAPKPKLTVPKPKLVDVAAPPRTLGPIEELKTMKLGDFRRLGKTAVDVVDKIKSKIQLISETGIGRHMQAIKAWQASPVYQIYITIGGSSIEQAKSVEDIIATRQSAGQETLTLSEFEAIVDLNQKLRF